MRATGLVLPVALFIGTCALPAAAAHTELLSTQDLEDLAMMKSDHPTSLELLGQADAAFAQESWAKAAELYAELTKHTGQDAMYPYKRRCQALTELEKRAEAVTACQAMLTAGIPEASAVEAMVAALTLGDGPMSAPDLRLAQTLVARAEGFDPEGPWTVAATCHLAAKAGDTRALADCSKRLAEIAPGQRMARRPTKAQPATQKGRTLQLGLLLAFAAALLGTAIHALLRGRRAPAGAAVALVLLLGASPARAQDFGIAEETGGPLMSGPPTEDVFESGQEVEGFKEEMKVLQELTDMIKAAEASISEKNDWKAAIATYNQVVVKVPYFVKGWRRLCEGYNFLNLFEEGEHACRQVLASNEANAWDRAMLVHYLLVGKAGKTPAARDEARRLAEEAVSTAPGERWGYDARCEIALATEDLKALSSCLQKLRELAPDDRKTAYLGWWLALREGRYDDAEKVVDEAVTNGLDAPSAATMRREIDTKRPLLSRVYRHLPLGLGAGALAALLVLALPRVLRSLRLRQGQPVKRHG